MRAFNDSVLQAEDDPGRGESTAGSMVSSHSPGKRAVKHGLFQKAKPVHDVKRRNLWMQERDRCAVCGIATWQMYRERWPFWLQCHHICKPGRSDEPCNFLPVCERCHRVIEGERVPCGKGIYCPPLPMGVVLWIKREMTSKEWRPGRLAELYHRALPELQEIPDFYLQERERWGATRG